jgi:hypothetical protein
MLLPCKRPLQLFHPSLALTDTEEKIKAQQAIVEGPLKEKFALLSKLLVSVSNKYFPM